MCLTSAERDLSVLQLREAWTRCSESLGRLPIFFLLLKSGWHYCPLCGLWHHQTPLAFYSCSPPFPAWMDAHLAQPREMHVWLLDNGLYSLDLGLFINSHIDHSLLAHNPDPNFGLTVPLPLEWPGKTHTIECALLQKHNRDLKPQCPHRPHNGAAAPIFLRHRVCSLLNNNNDTVSTHASASWTPPC